jgi:hypothetical protein
VYILEELNLGNFLIAPLQITNGKIVVGYVGDHEVTTDTAYINGLELQQFKIQKFPNINDYYKYKTFLDRWVAGDKTVEFQKETFMSKYPKIAKMFATVNFVNMQIKKDEYVYVVKELGSDSFLVSPLQLVKDNVFICSVESHEMTTDIVHINGLELAKFKCTKFPNVNDYYKYKTFLDRWIAGDESVEFQPEISFNLS